jgi:hypothetical protein
MSQIGLHDPFEHLKHNLWSKERSGIKLAIWFPTTKNQESTNSLACRWCATYRWKTLDEGYNFAMHLILIGGLPAKLWGPKVAGIPTLAISGLPFGSPGTKCHLDVSLVERHKVYYKGEGGGFPQVQVVVSLMSPRLPMAHPNTKKAPTMR